MKLKNLQITNFRCFESLSMDLDSQLTVLVAKNGQGKSSTLDAIRIGLWSFVSGFDLAHTQYNDTANSITIDDVRLSNNKNNMVRKLNTEIILQVIYDNKQYQWKRFRDSEKPLSKVKDDNHAKEIKQIATDLQSKIREDIENIELPVFGYYGTGRLWSQKKLTPNKKAKKDNDVYMRLFAYRDCLDPSSSYKHFSDWFIWIFECYREEQIRQAEKGILHESNPKWKETILTVQQAINDVLQTETGWYDLEYSVSNEKSLILNHSDYGKLKVEQLSDGIRGILAMVGDIAYRCIKLNWHLGINAAKETQGIVMIDEIELHLHPAWQQNILSNLCKAFPNIQFIITTHSPQVLSTVASHQIRILDEGNIISTPDGIEGAEASRVLQEVFGVSLRPQHLDIVKTLNEYLQLVNNDEWDKEPALSLREKLEKWCSHEPELIRADVKIRMKKHQRKL